MGMMEDEASFSRSGRSGRAGSVENAVKIGVSNRMEADITMAWHAYRKKMPNASQAEMLRSLIDESLNGAIVSILGVFPQAESMDVSTAISTMAALNGMSVSDYRDYVLIKHIFGSLWLHEYMIDHGHEDDQSESCSSIGTPPTCIPRRAA